MNHFEADKRVAKTDPVSHTPSPTPHKAAWHRPTVTFVPLQRTAINTGSALDLSSGSDPTPK